VSPVPDGPFSQPSRIGLIDAYFAGRAVAAEDAWKDVYRLLLWADSTTGLAHCYESDKSQPGRPWYARTLAFHAWLADQLGVTAGDLPDELDWMFREVIAQVAASEHDRRIQLEAKASEQRTTYAADMPEPGDDPELRQLIEPLLPADPAAQPSDDVIRDVLRKVRTHIASENKRKNLLGRGFEDVLAGVLTRMPGGGPPLVRTQAPIHTLRGFHGVREGDKDEKVDLYAESQAGERVLVSAKWSVRADREKQMAGDFATYVACNDLREPFRYVWITNEFDGARLVANATNTHGNAFLFTDVVHVSPDALRVVHELNGDRTLRSTAGQLKQLLDSGRIRGLGEWLADVAT
jgi:hypothetical protein